MNSSSNLLVLGATGQVGKLVAKTLKRRGASFSVGSRRRANLEELAEVLLRSLSEQGSRARWSCRREI